MSAPGGGVKVEIPMHAIVRMVHPDGSQEIVTATEAFQASGESVYWKQNFEQGHYHWQQLFTGDVRAELRAALSDIGRVVVGGCGREFKSKPLWNSLAPHAEVVGVDPLGSPPNVEGGWSRELFENRATCLVIEWANTSMDGEWPSNVFSAYEDSISVVILIEGAEAQSNIDLQKNGQWTCKTWEARFKATLVEKDGTRYDLAKTRELVLGTKATHHPSKHRNPPRRSTGGTVRSDGSPPPMAMASSCEVVEIPMQETRWGNGELVYKVATGFDLTRRLPDDWLQLFTEDVCNALRTALSGINRIVVGGCGEDFGSRGLWASLAPDAAVVGVDPLGSPPDVERGWSQELFENQPTCLVIEWANTSEDGEWPAEVFYTHQDHIDVVILIEGSEARSNIALEGDGQWRCKKWTANCGFRLAQGGEGWASRVRELVLCEKRTQPALNLPNRPTPRPVNEPSTTIPRGRRPPPGKEKVSRDRTRL
jgi:hypothetical protein